jgi:hypothetical protein
MPSTMTLHEVLRYFARGRAYGRLSSRLAFAALCSVALLTACGDDGGGGPDATLEFDAASIDAPPGDAAPGADANPGAVTATIAPECAPDDGPALRVTLIGDVDANCRVTDGPSLEVTVFFGDITAPATIDFSESQQLGFGSSCPGGAPPCQFTSTGQVEFDAFTTGASASGSFVLEFGDGTRSGAFEATWCEPSEPLLCG